jgi:Glycosyltransferase family 87
MTHGSGPPDRFAWLDREMNPRSVALAVVASMALFVGVVLFLGGPTQGDVAESAYSTWAIAHGDFACSYPGAQVGHFPTIAEPFASTAPLYPLLAGGLSALIRIGHHVPFPPASRMGHGCARADEAILKWSIRSSAIGPTLNLSYASGILAILGAAFLLSATPQWRRGRSAVALALIGLSPALLMTFLDTFHPQDVLAMGLVLAAGGATLRGRPLLTGALLGLAITSQQFALLALAPLIVAAEPRHRRSVLGATAVAVALIGLPLVIVTSGRALGPVIAGSSRVTAGGANALAHGGTILFATGVHGAAVFIVSRLVPLAATAGLSLYVARRWGSRPVPPGDLLSLVAACLGARLVFEVNLFGYYFMAVGVALVAADAVAGRLRPTVLGWLALTAGAFNLVPWGFFSNWTVFGNHYHADVPGAIAVVATVVGVGAVFRRRLAWWLPAGILLVVLTCIPELWGHTAGLGILPTWAWQLILVPTAMLLAVQPLVVRREEPVVGHAHLES